MFTPCLQSSVLCEPAVGGFGGVPAGCQCDKNNVLWIADMRLGLITVDKQGMFTQVHKFFSPTVLTMTQLYNLNKAEENKMIYIFGSQVCQEDDAGQTMQGCNDCAFDYDGNLWITAPAGKIAPHQYERSMEVDYVQNLHFYPYRLLHRI